MMKPAATCTVLLLTDASTQEALASLSCKDSREPNGLSSGTGLIHPVVFSPPQEFDGDNREREPSASAPQFFAC